MLKIIALFAALLIGCAWAELKIEIMKEGLTDLKTTILKSPNITEFAGSANEAYIGGTSGELVPFNPIDGCSELTGLPGLIEIDENSKHLRFSTVNGKSEQVIVLVSRGGCSFNQKFKNAQKIKGVVGVLVFNGINDSMPVDDILLTNNSDDLPGYLISNSLGVELNSKMTKYRTDFSSSNSQKTPYIEITMTPISIDATNRANKFVQIALIAIIIILALSFGTSIVIHMRATQFAQQYHPSGNNQSDGADRTDLKPIDVEFLQKLPLKSFKGRRRSVDSPKNSNSNSNSNNTTRHSNSRYSGIKSPTSGGVSVPDEKGISPKEQDMLNEYFEMLHHDWPMNDSCPICLDEFNCNEVLNELPCGHCYHIACIQPWLQYRSPCCPLCKLDVREEFKVNKTFEYEEAQNDNQVKIEDVMKGKLKNIWNKLILKTSTISETEVNESTAPPRETENTQTPERATSIQIPQRALIQDSENFQSVPL